MLTIGSDTWASVMDLLNRNSFNMDYTNFWGHSDADMLEVGNGPYTTAEERSHFAFWAVMKSPLLIGCDLAKITQSSLKILKNKYLLDFNQDPVIGEPAKPYKWGTNPDWTFNATNPAEYWSGKSSKHGIFLVVLNVQNQTVIKNLSWGDVPGLEAGKTYRLIDAWRDVDTGCYPRGVNLEILGHDTAVLVVKDTCNAYGSKTSGRSGKMATIRSAVD
jgi:alpha-galactosidase